MATIENYKHVQFSNSIEIHKTEDDDDLNQRRPLIRRLKNERPNSYSSIQVWPRNLKKKKKHENTD